MKFQKYLFRYLKILFCIRDLKQLYFEIILKLEKNDKNSTKNFLHCSPNIYQFCYILSYRSGDLYTCVCVFSFFLKLLRISCRYYAPLLLNTSEYKGILLCNHSIIIKFRKFKINTILLCNIQYTLKFYQFS